MLYQSVSSKSIIAKLRRDFDLQGTRWIYDSYEWMGEAVRVIGHSCGFIQKSQELFSHNHRAAFPCDFLEIKEVEYKCRPLKKGTNQLMNQFHINEGVPTFTGEFPLWDDTCQPEGEFLPEMNWEWQRHYYLLNNDYIITSFRHGKFMLHYLAIPIDEDGFPFIADGALYKEAVEWYCMYKLLGRGYTHPVWNVKEAYAKWMEYLPKAQNEAAGFSIQGMDAFRNMWARLTPNTNLPERFFEGGEERERIWNV
jgi:hypothetical protein